MPRSVRKCDSPSTIPGERSRRGWELLQAGDADGSLACHGEATSSPTTGPLNWFHRARSEQALGRTDEARASFTHAVKPVKGHTLPAREGQEAWFQLASLQKAAGLFEESAAAYREVIAMDPTLSGAQIMLGVVLRDLGRVEESVDAYTVGLALNPSVAGAQYNRAQGLLALGRRAEAADGFEATLRADPKFALAYEALGDLLADAGQLQRVRGYRPTLRPLSCLTTSPSHLACFSYRYQSHYQPTLRVERLTHPLSSISRTGTRLPTHPSH